MADFLDLSRIPARGAVVGLLSATTLVAVVAAFDTRMAAIIMFGMLIATLATAKFILLRSWMRKRKAQSMTGELTQQSAAAPAGVSDASRRARLDDMRRTFGDGLAKFGNAQNIYKFPWYLIVGEPGSGKTEAIRHCNVGFPPGLQNELQGVGGTINMNWWFTNQAVFLDTAGRLMFDEVKPGESNEWKEFLQLLVRNRPNCPVNGLLLIIPTDALIKDTDSKLNEKAGKIAAQFDLIQRTLDIRFPVFVMITKCDMMSGFREFFDDFADAQSVNQMLGWSNPEERDAPFQPDRVTDHLATVVQRIKKRRLSLLRDPIPQKGGERRTDEVDALYSLPQSIQLLAPRLRQYLEKIFVAGPWSPKPLFLRGIYFTSSMREGAALDQELAEALGLSADQLAEAKVWEKERAYFLRDIFTEKVFRERGLVTRATDTKKMLRKRGLILWGTATLLALSFVGFTVYAYQQFAESIKQHSDVWSAAKNPDDWKDANWKPVVSADKPGDTHMRFHGVEPPVKVGETSVPLLAYHDQLRVVATKPIETGWVYWWVRKAARLDADRLKAQRIVYEGSVVYPLVQAARYRMQNEAVANAIDAGEGADARMERETRALAALIRIESDNISKEKKIEEIPDVVLLPLLQYVTASKAPADEEKLKLLRGTFTATYTGNPNARWVPERLAAGSGALAENAPIAAGLGRLKALAGDTVRGQLDSAAKIGRIRDDLRKFREIEREMEATASGPGESKQKADKLNALFAELTLLKEATDAKLKSATDEKLLTGEKLSMVAAYQQLVAGSQGRSSGNIQLLRDAVKPFLTHEKAKLFKEVDDSLGKTLANLSEQVQNTFNEKEREELKQLDPYLEDFGDRRRIYAVRFATYQEAAQVASRTDKFDDLIGKSWAPYATVLKEIDDVKSQLPIRQGQFGSPNLVPACNGFLKLAEERRLNVISAAYLEQTRAKLESAFFEPLISDGGRRERPLKVSERNEALTLIDKWKLDFSSPDFQKIESTTKTKLTSLLSDFEAMKAAAAAYDEYARKYANLRVHVRLTSPGAYKWHIVQGGGQSANIFKGESFATTVEYGKNLPITLIDPVNGRKDGGGIDTRRPVEQSIHAGGDTLRFSVALVGEVPTPPQPGPKKSSVTGKLR